MKSKEKLWVGGAIPTTQPPEKVEKQEGFFQRYDAMLVNF